METSIASLIGPQAKNRLLTFSEASVNPGNHSTERKSRFVKLLDTDRELSTDINDLTSLLQVKNVPMPLIHITSSAIETPNGIVSSGFIENITANGFRARDTNVAGFMRRDIGLRFASPLYLHEHPDKYLQDLSLILERYRHHGLRTNKKSLGGLQNKGRGIPTMMAIDAQGIKLEKASDYDDHFILNEPADPTKIIGTIDLKDISQDATSLKRVTRELLLDAKDYYGRHTTGSV